MDITRLRAAAHTTNAAKLLDAVSTYESGVLSEFTFDEPGFDEWALTTREECQGLALRAGVAFLSLADTGHDAEAAVRVARKRLTIDPYFEPAHRTQPVEG